MMAKKIRKYPKPLAAPELGKDFQNNDGPQRAGAHIQYTQAWCFIHDEKHTKAVCLEIIEKEGIKLPSKPDPERKYARRGNAAKG